MNRLSTYGGGTEPSEEAYGSLLGDDLSPTREEVEPLEGWIDLYTSFHNIKSWKRACTMRIAINSLGIKTHGS
jgi:hypothetical protein